MFGVCSLMKIIMSEYYVMIFEDMVAADSTISDTMQLC
jgi:hypothetical protein